MLQHYGIEPVFEELFLNIALYNAGKGVIVDSAADIAASAELLHSLRGVHYSRYLAVEFIETRI